MEFSKTVVPYLNVTTHIEGRKDDDLLSRKGGSGYPYFAALDSEGGLIAQNTGDRTVDGFKETMQKAQEFVDLGAKAAAGDEQAKIEYAIRELELGRIGYDAAKERLAGSTLNPEQSGRLDSARARSAIREELEKIYAAQGSPDSIRAAGDRFYALLESGAKPGLDTMEGGTFANVLANWTQGVQDIVKLEKVHAYLKEVLPAESPKATAFLDHLAGRIRDLKDSEGQEESGEEDDDGPEIEESGD